MPAILPPICLLHLRRSRFRLRRRQRLRWSRSILYPRPRRWSRSILYPRCRRWPRSLLYPRLIILLLLRLLALLHHPIQLLLLPLRRRLLLLQQPGILLPLLRRQLRIGRLVIHRRLHRLRRIYPLPMPNRLRRHYRIAHGTGIINRKRFKPRRGCSSRHSSGRRSGHRALASLRKHRHRPHSNRQ